MNLEQHCKLCDNLEASLEYGILCGLTDKKPQFNRTCSKIQLNKNLKRELGLIHIEIEKLKKKKIGTYIYFLSFIGIGCILIYIEKDFIQELDLSKSSPYMKYSELAISFVVILTGFIFFNFAFKRLIKYQEKKKEIKSRKASIDAVLDRYQIKYSCNIVFGEKSKGKQQVNIEFKSNNNRLFKDSKTILQV